MRLADVTARFGKADWFYSGPYPSLSRNRKQPLKQKNSIEVMIQDLTGGKADYHL
jgi:hypothetical protein